MRRFLTASLCAGAGLLSAPAGAQYNPVFMADVIGSTVGNMANAGHPERCLDGFWEPTPQQAARFTAEAEPAMRKYLELAAAGADLSPAFTDSKSDWRWAINGDAADFASIRDPWASRIAKLELIGLRLSGNKVRGRGLWRAVAADGTELGTYDGLFRRKTKGFGVTSLDLFAPGSAKQPLALTAFCYTPGDIETFREARAKREEEKAARRAAREARSSASR